jgi:hypothetical protein
MAESQPPRVGIRKFDTNNFKENRVILIAGRRGTGKSTLLADLLSKIYRQFDAACGITPTQDSVDLLLQFLPDSCIFDEFDEKFITRLITGVRKLNKKRRYPRILMLLDDCMFDPKTMKNKAMRDIHMNGRHLGMFLVNIVQYVIDVPKPLRAQIDYVFALRESNPAYRKGMHENFFGILGDYEKFSKVMDACTENNGCLVVDVTSTSNNPEDAIFWYKAKMGATPKMVGNRDFWKLSHQYYEPPAEEDDDEEPIPGHAKKNQKVTSMQQAPPSAHRKSSKKPQPLSAIKGTSKKGNKREDLSFTVEKMDVNGDVVIDIEEQTQKKPVAIKSAQRPQSSMYPEFQCVF